jgi:hypothetical protein
MLSSTATFETPGAGDPQAPTSAEIARDGRGADGSSSRVSAGLRSAPLPLGAEPGCVDPFSGLERA